MTRRLPGDVARCEGRAKDHPHYPECAQCRRMTAPPSDHPWQSWMRGWAGHGECPDKIEDKK